jgi:hypothetical protein
MKLKTNKTLPKGAREKLRNKKNEDWIEKIIYDQF